MSDQNCILFVYERDMASVELVRNQFKSMLMETRTAVVFKKCTKVRPADIDAADTLIMIRPHNYLSYKIAQKARKTGCFLVFFMDDDMFHYPPSMHSIPWRIQILKKVLQISDVLMTGNPNILNRYKKDTVLKRGNLCHIAVSKEEEDRIPKKKADSGDVKLVYAAGGMHTFSIERYIIPILDYLNENYNGEISMTFIGVKPDFCFDKYKFEINYVEPMALDKYREWMLNHCYDIGFAPLENTPFNNNKYFNKFIEYTLTGVVGIYSNCCPYTYVIQDGMNGLLANDSANEWIRKTILMIRDKNLRSALLENAVKQISEHFSEKKIYESLENNFYELFERREKVKHCRSLWADKLIYWLFLMLDSLYLTVFYLKKVGWRGVIRKIAAHVRWKQIYR